MKRNHPADKHFLPLRPPFFFLGLPLLLVISVFLFSFSVTNCFSETLSGLEIMRQVYAREQEKTMSVTVEMILSDNDGHKRIRKMETFTSRTDQLTKRVIFFLDPPDVKGTALLTHDYHATDKEDEQWIYLPALHKTKRISAGNRCGSFMGSDFSYSDLTRKLLELYSYRLIKEQKIGQYPVWIIESIPKEKDTIDQNGYTKSLFLVRKDNFVIIRAVHWLKDKATLKYNEITKLEKIDGIWVPLEIQAKTVHNGKTVHQTLLRNQDIRLNQPIDEKLFTKRRLERGL